MDVQSVGPLKVGSVLWQSPRGGWVLTVVAKATFELVPGEARLAERQDEICDRDRAYDDDARGNAVAETAGRSVYLPSDLAPFKPHADVMLVGHAFAPRDEPVRSLVARVAVGEIDKSIEMVADRIVTAESEILEGPRFSRMPLRYERAAAGADASNPVGVRGDAVDTLGRSALPNLQAPFAVVTGRNDSLEPVGFAPISEGWWARRQRLGAHAKTWSPANFGERPLPEDIDPSYFNAAPRDQLLAGLRDDVTLILENLHPVHALLATRLPSMRPRAFVELETGLSDLRMAPDTLWIDTDRAVGVVTWRGQVLLEAPAQRGTVYVALELASRPLAWSDVLRMLDRRPPQSSPHGAGRPGTAPGLVMLPAELRALPFAQLHPDSSNAAPSSGSVAVSSTVVSGVSPIAASVATPNAPSAEAGSAKRAHLTPPTADVMTLSAAIASGKAPPWLAARAARAAAYAAAAGAPANVGAPGNASGAASLASSASSNSLVSGGPPLVVGGAAPIANVQSPLASTIPDPAKGDEITDSTLMSGRVVRGGTKPFIDPAIIAAATSSWSQVADPRSEATPNVAPQSSASTTAREAMMLAWSDPRAARLAVDGGERGLLHALLRARACDGAGLARAALEAIDAEGAFVPPVVRVDGQLTWVDDASTTNPQILFGSRARLAHLTIDEGPPVPIYVPETAATNLPLARELRVSLFAEIHDRQDPTEPHALALLPLAIARQVTFTSR